MEELEALDMRRSMVMAMRWWLGGGERLSGSLRSGTSCMFPLPCILTDLGRHPDRRGFPEDGGT